METTEKMSMVSQRIKTFNARFLPDKVQLKYKLLAADPFRFFRGTCHLFYEDLVKVNLPASPNVWMCGDLHLENFGSFKGDNRLVYFDINDFDESILGPASWELARFLTCIFVASPIMGIREKEALQWATLFLETYSAILAKGKARYIEIETANGIVRSFLEKVSLRTQNELLQERTRIEKKKLVLNTGNKKYLKLDKELKDELINHLQAWTLNQEGRLGSSEVLDVCFRIAGIGSLGVKRYLFLLQFTKNKKKYRLLDMKQVMPSSLSPFMPVGQPAWPAEAERVKAIKYRMQNVSPALLSTTVFNYDSFLLQELQPMEDKIDFNLIKDPYKDITEVINNMALLVASAQLRSSGRQGTALIDDLIEFGKDDQWKEAIIEYGRNYAGKIREDYQQFESEYRNGFFA
jgi:uncharacterized protein (DUF2252 family)